MKRNEFLYSLYKVYHNIFYMKKIFLVATFCILNSAFMLAQRDSVPPSYKLIEVSIFHTNLCGSVDDLSMPLSEDGQEISMVEYSSRSGYSINYTTQKQWERYPRWSMKIQLGVYSVAGDVRFRRTGASISGSNQIFESDKNISFRSLYLNTGYLFNFKMYRKRNYNFSFGPVLAGRIGNTVLGDSDIYRKDYTTNPAFSEFEKNILLESDDELVGFQGFLKVGFSKQFMVNQNFISLGVEYNRSLLNLHNAGSTKSHMYGVSLGLGFAQ